MKLKGKLIYPNSMNIQIRFNLIYLLDNSYPYKLKLFFFTHIFLFPFQFKNFLIKQIFNKNKKYIEIN